MTCRKSRLQDRKRSIHQAGFPAANGDMPWPGEPLEEGSKGGVAPLVAGRGFWAFPEILDTRKRVDYIGIRRSGMNQGKPPRRTMSDTRWKGSSPPRWLQAFREPGHGR
jgi:hypothetical protein